MKTTLRALLAIAVALALSSVFVREAFAYITLNGNIPAGTTPVVILQANNQPGATGVLKFKFSAPAHDAGVAYALNFCIGPVSNPCGLPTSYVVVVPGGQERLAVVNANVFATNVLVVSQGTKRPVPFAVTME
jgi:hypothetical protein